MPRLANSFRPNRNTKANAATIEWKGAMWRSVRTDLSIADLLATLKGFGPMEIIEFVKPGYWRGRISLGVTGEGKKEVTVFELVVHGEKGKGKGRSALQWLRGIFNAELYAQEFGGGYLREWPETSLPFWIRMFREGILKEVQVDAFCLHRGMTETEIEQVEERVRELIAARENGSEAV